MEAHSPTFPWLHWNYENYINSSLCIQQIFWKKYYNKCETTQKIILYLKLLHTRISPDKTSRSDRRLCPSLKSSNKSLQCRPAWNEDKIVFSLHRLCTENFDKALFDTLIVIDFSMQNMILKCGIVDLSLSYLIDIFISAKTHKTNICYLIFDVVWFTRHIII